jgi:hypothetical protein
MKKNNMKMSGKVILAILVSAVFVGTLSYGQGAAEQSTPSNDVWGTGARSVEGAWDVTVTLRNCADGVEIRSFPRLNTFMQGGTMQETAAGGTAAQPALRSPGHGIWETVDGRSFRYTLKFLRLNADGSPAGYVRETRVVDVSPIGTEYSATGTAFIHLPNGTVIGPVCATEAGTKLTIE